MIGTIAELAWAWQLQIPVVAVIYPDNHLMTFHPFIREFVAHSFESVEYAADFVISYYGEE